MIFLIILSALLFANLPWITKNFLFFVKKPKKNNFLVLLELIVFYFILGAFLLFIENQIYRKCALSGLGVLCGHIFPFFSIFIPWLHLQSHLEVTATLLIIGCGKLGIIAGSMLAKLPLEVIGVRRNLGLLKPPFKIMELNIFSKDFLDQLSKIKPTYIIYSVSADSSSEQSYLKNYYELVDLLSDF